MIRGCQGQLALFVLQWRRSINPLLLLISGGGGGLVVCVCVFLFFYMFPARSAALTNRRTNSPTKTLHSLDRSKGFSASTAEDVESAIQDLLKTSASTSSSSSMDGVLLDLRNNAGGLLGGGIDTATLFLPQVPVLVLDAVVVRLV